MNYNMQNYMESKIRKDLKSMEEEKPIKNEVSEKEAMEIFNELVQVLSKHNLSYQCACRISLALNESLMAGAVELMRIDGTES